MKVHNFSAGPGILPDEVLRKSAEAVLEFNDLNLSLIEISHRSKDFEEVMERARALALELLGLGSDYEAIFVGGGASLQFTMVPMNVLKVGGKAAYTKTGTWAANACEEAAKVGTVEIVASSQDRDYTYIPKDFSIPADADYLHITTNNTVYGSQWKEYPTSPVPLVADMSSDIFSKKIDASKFSLIYAGAQKNMGPAGATLVVYKKDFVGKSGRVLPSMLDYEVHGKKDSMFNTPPVFPVFVSMLTMQWLKDNGGIEWIQKINEMKANAFYTELDRNPMFVGTVDKADRSNMNATFLLKNTELEKPFEAMLKEAQISGLKGHRSVGGYRASMYNALPLESVKVLVNVMQEFTNQFG